MCKPENSSYETRNFSSNILSNIQKKCWMKYWSGLLWPITDENYPTLQNALFGAVILTKNAKYKYSGYGTRFDRKLSFSFAGGGFGQNVIIFGVDMSS